MRPQTIGPLLGGILLLCASTYLSHHQDLKERNWSQAWAFVQGSRTEVESATIGTTGTHDLSLRVPSNQHMQLLQSSGYYPLLVARRSSRMLNQTGQHTYDKEHPLRPYDIVIKVNRLTVIPTVRPGHAEITTGIFCDTGVWEVCVPIHLGDSLDINLSLPQSFDGDAGSIVLSYDFNAPINQIKHVGLHWSLTRKAVGVMRLLGAMLVLAAGVFIIVTIARNLRASRQ